MNDGTPALAITIVGRGGVDEPLQLGLVLLAIGVGLAVALFSTRRQSLPMRAAVEGVLAAAVGGAFTGHAVHLLLTEPLPVLGEAPWRLLTPLEGGFNSFGVYFGGLIAAMGVWLYRRAPAWSLADAFAPGALIGAAVARLGCLWVGCDIGRPGGWSALNVRYVEDTAVFRDLATNNLVERVDDAHLTVPLHAFPLYEAVPLFVVGVALLRWPNLLGAKPGQRALGAGALYLAVRFVAEHFRGGLVPVFAGLTILQLIAGIGLCLFTALWLRRAVDPAPTATS